MKLIWSDDALADLRRLAGHLVTDAPDASLQVIQRLTLAGEGLRLFPLIGTPIGDRRRLVIDKYCLFYRIGRSPLRITILRVRHGKELPFGFEKVR